MPKKKPEVRLRSWGIYTRWDADSKSLPELREVTTHVPAEVDIEFGLVVNVRGARNEKLFYCINHPGILDADGNQRPPFDGTVHVRTNHWDFYLGDTIWLPVDDKLGTWTMWIELHGQRVAEKSFEVF